MSTDIKPVYKQVLKIKPPKHLKWEPEQAYRLMAGLYAITCPLNLVIRATEHQILWMIEVGEPNKVAVLNAVQSAYPQAYIEVSPKSHVDIGYYRYQLELEAPSFAPLRGVTGLGKIDPLAGVIAATRNITGDEEMVYELVLYPPERDYQTLAGHFLKISAGGWAQLLTERGRAETRARQLQGADKVQRFDKEITQAIIAKVDLPMMEARLFIKIKAHSVKRSEALIDQFLPSLNIFDNVNLNFLTPARTDTYPLLLTATEVSAMWHLPTQDIQTMGIEWVSGAVAPLPSQLVQAAKTKLSDSIVLGQNTYQGRTYPVVLPYPDRVTHVALIGAARMGKSNLMHQMIHQDIENGHGVALIDPHGDLVNDILRCSIPESRLNDVVLFNATDSEYPIGLNLLSYTSGQHFERTASGILSVMRKIFEDQWSATRMEDALYNSISTLLNVPGSTVLDIPRLLSNPEYRARILKTVRDPIIRSYWRDDFDSLSSGQQDQVRQPINNRLRRFFRDPGMRRIMCQESSIDFRRLMDDRKIFLASLGGLAKVESETLGSLLMSKIQMAANSRGDIQDLKARKPFYLYVDEVQNFISTSLSVMLSEMPKFGLSLVVANQYLSQLEGETLDAVVGNIGTNIMFRVGRADAPNLARLVAPQVTAEDLLNLSRFHAVVKMQLDSQTLPAFSMMTLPPLPAKEDADATPDPESNNPTKPPTATYVRDNSRKTYGLPAEEIDREIERKYNDDEPPNTVDDTDAPDNGDEPPKRANFLG